MYHSTENLILKLRHYCAYQERSQFEVEQKLNTLGADNEQSGTVMIHLIQEGFLNEQRFAIAFARGKFRMQGWGKQKIKAGLKAKKVSDPLIKIALDSIDETEYRKSLLDQFRKLLSQNGTVESAKQKLYARGYEFDLIQEASKELFSSDE